MQRQGGLEAWSTRRVRFEHGDGVSAFLDQLERAKIVVVQNPTHFAALPGLAERFSAEQRAALLPLRSLLGRGIAIALGSDGELNPFLGILLASVHPANPGEAISREQALVAYTRGSAYAEFAEAVKGTLAPGMLADLAVLSQNIFEVSKEQLPATTSVLTLVGGRVVYSAAAMEGGLSVPSQGD
jgi:predicted amidohydrolase YtcJ